MSMYDPHPGPAFDPHRGAFADPYADAPVHRWGEWFNPWSWEHIRHEVVAESCARIAIAGPPGAGKATLFNRLQGWAVLPEGERHAAGHPDDAEYSAGADFGTFVLVDLPGPDWDAAANADLVLFLLDATQGMDAEAYGWICRIRGLGRPLVVAVNKIDALGGEAGVVCRDIERRLAGPVVQVSARDGTHVAERLLPRLADANPAAAMALGRAVPAARPVVAHRIMRRAALVATVGGMQPLPLVDIPIQLAAQMRLLVRLSALYGRAETTDGSRQVMASTAGALAVRFAIQQLLKLVPGAGWVVSGLLSGVTMMALGRAAAAYFEGRLRRPGLRGLVWRRPRRMQRSGCGRPRPRRLRLGRPWLRRPLHWPRRRQQPDGVPQADAAPQAEELAA